MLVQRAGVAGAQQESGGCEVKNPGEREGARSTGSSDSLQRQLLPAPRPSPVRARWREGLDRPGQPLACSFGISCGHGERVQVHLAWAEDRPQAFGWGAETAPRFAVLEMLSWVFG